MLVTYFYNLIDTDDAVTRSIFCRHLYFSDHFPCTHLRVGRHESSNNCRIRYCWCCSICPIADVAAIIVPVVVVAVIVVSAVVVAVVIISVVAVDITVVTSVVVAVISVPVVAFAVIVVSL